MWRQGRCRELAGTKLDLGGCRDDAVSGEAVRTAQALSSVYQEKIYHFASKEDRERFEAARRGNWVPWVWAALTVLVTWREPDFETHQEPANTPRDA
jgi:hypothetical protein